MKRLRILGGKSLEGVSHVSGSKNSSLKILFASILTREPMCIEGIPELSDIRSSFQLLKQMGARIEKTKHQAKIQVAELSTCTAPYHLVRTMRASILCLGPLLARMKEAKVSLPGGCAIGSRPVNLHIDGLRSLGAEVQLQKGYIIGKAPNGLHGAHIILPIPSVGATENILMAATLAKGKTVLKGAAREPEIVDLGKALCKMGAQIKGIGTSTIEVEGVSELSGATHTVMPDRIEAATILLAGCITGGRVRVEGISPSLLTHTLEIMRNIGIEIEEGKNYIEVRASQNYNAVEINTKPFPGFPTDLQAQFMAFLSQVPGKSTIIENIFENRFMHVQELVRMGANIEIKSNTATIHGLENCFSGTQVMATDLRASASLILAALAAKGESLISRIYHLDRGYEKIEEKLSLLGADIARV